MISDRELDNYYGRDYYGEGRDYMDGPYWDDDLEEEEEWRGNW